MLTSTLSRDECRDILRSESVGHLGFTRSALPCVAAVAVEATGELIRCRLDTAGVAVEGQVVCLCVDHIEDDFVHRCATATGVARALGPTPDGWGAWLVIDEPVLSGWRAGGPPAGTPLT